MSIIIVLSILVPLYLATVLRIRLVGSVTIVRLTGVGVSSRDGQYVIFRTTLVLGRTFSRGFRKLELCRPPSRRPLTAFLCWSVLTSVIECGVSSEVIDCVLV